ncbi:unnamed protein product [Penicillium camemberti]|uniref:Str. FM013 n=1 Tax=Penicillium camemberti (strain FM 013) TaxID=1429867 RepID=A0A0G4PDU8_PENC3|nr:unnamed protein product [Penicillium camemberti]
MLMAEADATIGHIRNIHPVLLTAPSVFRVGLSSILRERGGRKSLVVRVRKDCHIAIEDIDSLWNHF